MTTNIVTALFSEGSRQTATTPLTQYDYGQILQFEGLDLPVAYEVHFADTPNKGDSVTQIGNEDGVEIPDILLQTAGYIYAWIFLHTGEDDGETRYLIKIPVEGRAKPTNETPTPVQQDAITEAIAALNEAVEQTGSDVETTQGYMERAETAAGNAEDSATAASRSENNASDYATNAANSASDAEGYAVRAETAAGITQSMTATAETLEPGSQATAHYADGVLTLGIPAGEDGEPGEPGHTPVITASKSGTTTTIYADGSAIATLEDGEDGDTPVITASKSGTVTTIYANGTAIAEISDGEQGSPGTPGYSPTATVTKVGSTATITITDKNGTTTASISDGENGQPGQDGEPGADGYSPTATVTKSGDTVTITITDKNGTTTASVSDGSDGQPGVGIPTGGTAGQILAKASGTNYDTAWVDKESVVTVSGTDPVIIGVADTRYICGEVYTISITPPQSGIIDVVFESGSTPAVLTLPNTVKMPAWFDGTLSANTVYEINIMDGIYGAVMTWQA